MLHFAAQTVRDFIQPVGQTRRSDAVAPAADAHLEAAITYLMRTIDACEGRGSSKGYKVLSGWMPAYPETTGYIVPTLIKLTDHTNDPKYDETARQLGQWLLSIQLENGGFVGREEGVTTRPVVFNTGMILLGLTALAHRTGEQAYVDAGQRAAAFLMSCQDADFNFVNNLSNDIIHTYNVRTAWALCKFGKLVDDEDIWRAGLGNADWTVTQQLGNGYFLNNQFKKGGQANTHGLGYILRGLLEIHLLSGKPEYLESVRVSADQVCKLYNERGWLAANFDENWNYTSKHLCLTGCAQNAIVLLKLARILDRPDYRTVANSLIRDVATTQNLTARPSRHFGAIKGSHPIYGAYAPLQYPNWATKFFIDAMLEQKADTAQANR